MLDTVSASDLPSSFDVPDAANAAPEKKETSLTRELASVRRMIQRLVSGIPDKNQTCEMESREFVAIEGLRTGYSHPDGNEWYADLKPLFYGEPKTNDELVDTLRLQEAELSERISAEEAVAQAAEEAAQAQPAEVGGPTIDFAAIERRRDLERHIFIKKEELALAEFKRITLITENEASFDPNTVPESRGLAGLREVVAKDIQRLLKKGNRKETIRELDALGDNIRILKNQIKNLEEQLNA